MLHPFVCFFLFSGVWAERVGVEGRKHQRTAKEIAEVLYNIGQIKVQVQVQE